MSHVLVTGGAGFIGSHVVDRLIADGHSVVVVDNLSTGKKEYINGKAQFHLADIRDYEIIAPLIHGCDAVFHLAADPRLQVSLEKPFDTYSVNVTGTLNVLEAARQAGGVKVIFASSCTIYGDCTHIPLEETMSGMPLSPYGLHKLMGEQYVRLYASLFGVPGIVLRYFNVFGPRKTADGSYPMVIPVFLKQKKEGKPLTIVGDGEQTRDYVHVNDVVEACITAWRSEIKDGSAYNIAGGKQRSVNAIANLIGGPTVTIEERKGEMRFVQASIAQAKKVLGWEPQVPFETGLTQLLH